MSEFKYACPVCGQHMKCDSSQAGTQMECPTCFQKITAPQAPATDDQKFIIAGTKKGERPAPNIPTDRAVAPKKNSPLAAVILLVLVCAAGAAVFALRGKIFKSSVAIAPTNQVLPGSGKAQTRPKPVLAAPSTNNATWTLNLDAASIPDSMTAGRVHGQIFNCDRVILQGGVMTMRVGAQGAPDFGVVINFTGATPEALAGQTINVATNAPRAVRVTLRWKEGGQFESENFTNGYAMRLEFGPFYGSHLPGKIYLCTPDDQKSYVAGTFNIVIREPRLPSSQRVPPRTHHKK